MGAQNSHMEFEQRSPGWRARARKVGRTPQEAAALEAALQRRRERLRAARQDTSTGQNGPPPPSRQAASRRNIPHQQPPPQEQEQEHERERAHLDVNFARRFLQACIDVERERQRCLRANPSARRRIEGSRAERRERNRARDLRRADAFEAEHPDLADARAAIRADNRLSDLAKTVLLLTMQIPEGHWTTYRAMQEYISEKRGTCSARNIGQCLKKSTLPAEEVPCHRVLEESGRSPSSGQMSLGAHNDDEAWAYDELRWEGVSFSDVGTLNEKPTGPVFRDFVGLPRI